MSVPGLIIDYAPVIIRQMRGRMANEAVQAQLDAIAAQLRQADAAGIRIATIVDLSQADRADAMQRRMQAKWFEEHEAVLRRVNLGTAFVVRSQLVRGAITAVFWMRPPPHDYTITVSFGDAIDWCIGKLQAHGIRPPERLLDDRASLLMKLSW